MLKKFFSPPTRLQKVQQLSWLSQFATCTLRMHANSVCLDFAPACPKAALLGAQAMRDQNIITPLHPQRRILRKAKPLAQLMKSRVCHEFACPIVPCSCTSRIPKQHSFDPPVRRQIRNMHRKFPVMFEALFRPSVQSMLLCECYCLASPMMQNITPR